ncbi:hypothetical protein TCE0_041r13502 [Talaromyces pinophilus]|uniref:Uncharacterized protein n=1 Tax=Talaromyces pinophilus TaxID=128442 RepID=A0A6V8HFX0_TALPI|nr:hypothetical protein TCE0_041r13502 [Talaromyces pinophilus]
MKEQAKGNINNMATTNTRQCLAIHAMSYSSKCLLHARRRVFDGQPLNLYAGVEHNHRKHKHKHLVEEAHPDGEFTVRLAPQRHITAYPQQPIHCSRT